VPSYTATNIQRTKQVGLRAKGNVISKRIAEKQDETASNADVHFVQVGGHNCLYAYRGKQLLNKSTFHSVTTDYISVSPMSGQNKEGTRRYLTAKRMASHFHRILWQVRYVTGIASARNNFKRIGYHIRKVKRTLSYFEQTEHYSACGSIPLHTNYYGSAALCWSLAAFSVSRDPIRSR
jgi:hypothetical protein